MTTQLPIWGWVVIVALMLAQGIWLFLDAWKHDKRPWLWGILGLVQFPLPILFYWFFVRKPLSEQAKKQSADSVRQTQLESYNNRSDV